jgi:phosphonatase-like hydrolase
MDFVKETMGRSKIEVFTELLGDRAVAANQAFERAYETRVRGGEVTPITGAERALDELQKGGVQVCLTTGFSPKTRDLLLEALGWASRADLVLSPVDAGRGRPYPDMVLTAVMRLGVDDVRDVAVAGDTANDLWSGWRAGAGVVAGVLTGAHGREELERAPHTHIIDSVADLPGLVFGGSS